jgi:hypothetical protein
MIVCGCIGGQCCDSGWDVVVMAWSLCDIVRCIICIALLEMPLHRAKINLVYCHLHALLRQ